MKSLGMVGVLGLVALTGCAHGNMRGSVAMKVSDDEAHVCLGEGEVKPGDRVAFLKNVCTGRAGGAVSRSESRGCQKVKLGEGEIVQILNRHYSVAKVKPGVTFEEGTIVEKF